MRDLVDHFFPPVHKVVEEEFTDFNYWRDELMDPDEFSDSDAEHDDDDAEDDEDEEGDVGEMGDSYLEEGELEDEDAEYGEEDEEYDEDEYDEENQLADSMLQEPGEKQGRLQHGTPSGDQEKVRQEQDEKEEFTDQERRRGGMLNDLDTSRLNQAKEFAEKELGAVTSEVVNEVGKFTGILRRDSAN
jgi:phosphatidate phosphatase LPIN